MADSTKTWFAAYLYYTEPWEDFLTTAVNPFVNTVFENKLAEQFFFIRYWERGPHIRLRFKGEKDILEQEVKPRLETFFLEHFEKHPSEQEETEWMKNLPEEQQFFPNNSIQYIEYEPEIERYGGHPAGIGIAEEQFEASSRAIFSIIEESENWGYDRALGAAIQLHLGFAAALDMDLAETNHFYDHIFRGWFGRAYQQFGENISDEELKKRQDDTLEAFEENFKKQKSALVPYHKTLWNAFDDSVEFTQEWLNIWINEMTDIGNKLSKAQERKALVIPEWFRYDPEIGVPEGNQMLWTILGSYIHMTNNRLGILNRDEAYLGYLIRESLKSI